MKVTYFPGCTLKNKARDLDEYARKSAEALGITLEEPGLCFSKYSRGNRLLSYSASL